MTRRQKKIIYSLEIDHGFSKEAKISYIDAKNRMWIFTDPQLVLYDIKAGTMIDRRELALFSEITSAVQGIGEDPFGNYWVGTQKGLYVFNQQLDKYSLFTNVKNESWSISFNNISTITETMTT
ncbi:MAG: hypothetical protein HC896_19170 [Bacteroidales bacterium]|nr:hypothetical protein [Bacteroidales bacterium]